MKNKKDLCTLTIMILLVFLTHNFHAHALKQATFPDSQSLQPIPLPPGGHANISGNTNSTVNNIPESRERDREEQVPATDATNTSNTPDEGDSTSYTLWSLIILVLVVIVFVIYYKKRKHS